MTLSILFHRTLLEPGVRSLRITRLSGQSQSPAQTTTLQSRDFPLPDLEWKARSSAPSSTRGIRRKSFPPSRFPIMSTDQPERTGRTTSFGSLIKRTKSNDLLGERKSSTTRLRKKSLEGQRRPSVSDIPPALPTVNPQPVIESFGGESYVPRHNMSTANGMHGAPPVPPLPIELQQAAVDPFARTESMTHRSRYSYAQSTSSTVNSPRRVRRRKDPTPYK